MQRETQIALAERFHELHHAPDMLILPNAWDAGSALIFEKAGFGAIGTTSAGVAYALGYPDGERVSLSDVLDVVRHMLRRVSVPLSVDVESGYATHPAQVAETVRQVIQAGAVGINLEDELASAEGVLIPLDEQCRRIQALVALKADMGIPFFINARTDVYLLSTGEPEHRLATAIQRCTAFIEAGADGVFVPGQLDPATIHSLVQALDAPLNVLAAPSNPTVADLQQLGVSRLSLGSGPARAALGLTQKIAYELRQQGSLTSMFSHATPYEEMNQLFE